MTTKCCKLRQYGWSNSPVSDLNHRLEVTKHTPGVPQGDAAIVHVHPKAQAIAPDYDFKRTASPSTVAPVLADRATRVFGCASDRPL